MEAARKARKVHNKMDELAAKAPEVEVGRMQFDVTTPDGDEVQVTFTYPKDRGIAVIRTISQMNQFGPGASDALLELKDPSILAAYEQFRTETEN